MREPLTDRELWAHARALDDAECAPSRRHRAAWHAPTSNHHPGVPPVGGLAGSPAASTWGGHRWSPWLERLPARQGMGLAFIASRVEIRRREIASCMWARDSSEVVFGRITGQQGKL